MSNVLINPSSGIIEFNINTAGTSNFRGLTGGSRIFYKNTGELNIVSFVTGDTNRFSVDGANGRLLTIQDTLTGSLFSVNDEAGIPIFEVFDDERVVAGQYNSYVFAISGVNVGIGTPTPTQKLDVRGKMNVHSFNLSGFAGNQPSVLTGDFWYDSTNLSLRSYHAGALRTIGLAKTFAVFRPRDNNGPTSAFATSGSRNAIQILEFDAASNESAVFVSMVPSGIPLLSGITSRIVWMASSATANNVRWSVQFEKMNTDMDADSFDVATSGTSTANGTAGIPSILAINSTSIDGLRDGDPYRVKLTRVASDAADTMAGDAQLIMLELQAVL